MKRAMFTAITLLWAACVAAAPGDATISFTVPLSLQKLDPAVQAVGSYCEVKDGNGTVIATAFGQVNGAISGNAISGNAVSQAVVPMAKVMSAKSWACSLMVESTYGNCFTNAPGSNQVPWCAFDASSKTTVKGNF